MSEPIKQPSTAPEGYSPKDMPEIMKLAQAVAGKDAFPSDSIADPFAGGEPPRASNRILGCRPIMHWENYYLPSAICSVAKLAGFDEGALTMFDKNNGNKGTHFFSAITGDMFTPMYESIDEKPSDSGFTACFFAPQVIKRAYAAFGRKCIYLSAAYIEENLRAVINAVKASIDKGLPVLSWGWGNANVSFDDFSKPHDLTEGCFIGAYENDQLFVNGPDWMALDGDGYSTTADGLSGSKGLFFVGEPIEKTPLREVCAEAFAAIPARLTLPPAEGVVFGKAAFDLWADTLLDESRFAGKTNEELKGLIWPLHCKAFCNVCTSNADHFVRAAAQELEVAAKLLPLYERFYQCKDRIWKRSGGFEPPVKKFRKRKFRMKIAVLLREMGTICDEIAESYKPREMPEIMKLAEEQAANRPIFHETHHVNGRPDSFETDRLIIRHVRPNDWRDMQALAVSNNASPYSDCDWLWPTDDEGVQKMCLPGNHSWAVEVKALSRLVCIVNFNGLDKEKKMDIGHVMNGAYLGHGYEYEALAVLYDYCFRYTSAKAIIALWDMDNKEKLAPLEKLGMELVSTGPGKAWRPNAEGVIRDIEGCTAVVTRKQWECANPTGYRPRTMPEIMKLAGEIKVNKPYTVKTGRGGAHISGVPRLRWGQWQDDSYSGAMALLLQVAGEDITYEQVAAWSGSCYRICQKDDLCPSGALPQIGWVDTKNVENAIGRRHYSVKRKKRRRKLNRMLMESIHQGIPVLCGHPRVEDEYGIICGYQKKPFQKFLAYGRSYFDYERPAQDQIYTEDQYFHADNYPGWQLEFYAKKGEPISAGEALKASLEACIKIYAQEPTEKWAIDAGYKFGDGAYAIWIDRLADPAPAQFEYDGKLHHHFRALTDARRAASVYLRRSCALLDGANRERLEKAAGLYEEMTQALLRVRKYHTEEVVMFEIAQDFAWSEADRALLAETLQQIREWEAQARVIVQNILDNWEDA